MTQIKQNQQAITKLVHFKILSHLGQSGFLTTPLTSDSPSVAQPQDTLILQSEDLSGTYL